MSEQTATLSAIRWADEPKPAYDVVIIGGGGHGLSTAYHLATRHRITNVAVLEADYIASGNTGRNTTIIRANYGIPEAIRFYQHSLERYQELEAETGAAILHQTKGIVWLAHTEMAMRTERARAAMNQACGAQTFMRTPEELKELVPQLDLTGGGRYPVLGGSHHVEGATARHDRVAWAVDAATLEATVIGPTLEFDDDRTVAVTGGQFDVSLDARPVSNGHAFSVRRGSRLTVGRRGSGARAYVAVSGGIAVAPVLGSRATHVMTRMGGLDGRPLRAGDLLPLGASRERRNTGDRFASRARDSGRLRILPGVHRQLFSDQAYRALQSGSYEVSQDSNRVGYRLEGTAIPHEPRADMISEATPMGAIQVPGSGLPILLMADRQTTGGYPQIATVIAADLPVAGQLGLGDPVSFVECLPGEAIAALVAREQSLLHLEHREAR